MRIWTALQPELLGIGQIADKLLTLWYFLQCGGLESQKVIQAHTVGHRFSNRWISNSCTLDHNLLFLCNFLQGVELYSQEVIQAHTVGHRGINRLFGCCFLATVLK